MKDPTESGRCDLGDEYAVQYGTVLVGTLRSSTELLAAGEDARRDAAAAVYGGDLGSDACAVRESEYGDV
eukprot:COSAG02_NODE_5369_length_4393_cov_8.932697_1_plen_70_part_00